LKELARQRLEGCFSEKFFTKKKILGDSSTKIFSCPFGHFVVKKEKNFSLIFNHRVGKLLKRE